MKTAIAVIVSGCALALGQPAFADGLSLAKGVKACEAELARHTPALKRYRAVFEDTYASDKHLWIAFNVLDADGRMDKFVCKVDRVTRIAAVAPKKRRLSDYMIAAPTQAEIEVAQNGQAAER